MDQEDVIIYNIIKLKKEGNLTICNNTDRTWGDYAKRSQSDTERQIPYDLIYIWNLNKKIKLMDTESRVVVAGSGD